VERSLREAEKERDGLRTKIDDLRSEREHRESERRRRFFSDVKALCGERGKERGLVELAIDNTARLLPDDVTIIDLPGASTDDASRWTSIRERADGCIFVSELDRAVSESAKKFLRQIREVMPHLLLVLTKVDNAFAGALTRGGDDPWAQVEQARRIGTRRFAREIGRNPGSVLSVAVAAEVALMPRESELGRRFTVEIAKLFHLLRHERAIILGAHAGSAIRRCIGSTSDAQQRAQQSYRDKIADLERKRTPLPEVFGRERLAAAEPLVRTGAGDAIAGAIAALQSGFAIAKRFAEQTVDGCPDRRGLADAVDGSSRALSERVRDVRREAYLELEAGIERAVDSISGRLFEELRERYGLLHKLERAPSSSPGLGAPNDELPTFATLVPEIRHALESFDRGRYVLGASGMVMGASAGALFYHWLGAMAGAAAGAVSAFARREGALRKRVLDIVTAELTKQEARYAGELRGAEAAVQSAIRNAVEGALERAIVRFGRWIAEPIEAEQAAIDGEQKKLDEIEQLSADLAQHDKQLKRLLDAAAAASVGLAR
jgi:hypothetical protein